MIWGDFVEWFRKEGCAHLWGGTLPPLDDWDYRRDLDICSRLYRQGEPLDMIRAVIKAGPDGVTMAWYWQRGERGRYNEVKGKVLKGRVSQRDKTEPVGISELLKGYTDA